MSDFGDSLCIMLLASDSTVLPDSLNVTESPLHVTVFYLGDRKNFDDQAVELMQHWALRAKAVVAEVTGVERFNGNTNADDAIVLTLRSPELTALNGEIRKSLKSFGIVSESKFANNYRPHVTVAYVSKSTPTPDIGWAKGLNIGFDRMHLSVGGSEDQFWTLPPGAPGTEFLSESDRILGGLHG